MSSLEQWLFVVPSWVVYLVAFALPCAEAAIFAGIVVPGESGLLIAGALAGLGHVHPAGVAACGVAGAVIGDSIGFEVGRYLGPRLRTSRLGRVVKPAHWRRAERFMGRYGAHAVFLGRWVSFGRALIPAIAGATGMRYRDFFAWNVLGGVTWGLAVTALGYIAGGSWRLVSDALGRGRSWSSSRSPSSPRWSVSPGGSPATPSGCGPGRAGRPTARACATYGSVTTDRCGGWADGSHLARFSDWG